MQINGYVLREAIKRWELRRNTAEKLFGQSLWRFDGDEKADVMTTAKQYEDADLNVAVLQTAQVRLNEKVDASVKVKGKIVAMTLGEAVKRVGGAGRIEKMWRNVTTDKQDRYDRGEERSRDKDQIQAKRTVSQSVALEKATEAATYAGALRASIAEANSRNIELDVDPKLFE